ncbi:MAG: site-specific integrase [Myxococcales bacterium]|nr:site-specific integrase [Myxococcales bacterium]
MSVRLERRERHGRARWVADIRVRMPSGALRRERRDVPGDPTSRRAALRWATAREAALIRDGLTPAAPATPTVAAFAREFLAHARALGRKPSTIASHESNLRLHLLPLIGRVRLDALQPVHVARIYALPGLGLGSRNKLAATLSALLRAAVAFGHLHERDRLRVRQVRLPRTTKPFYTRPRFEALLDAALALGDEHAAIVLLAGEAGLRNGELRGLHWRSINLETRALIVEHSDWRGELLTPKSNRYRRVPLSRRLVALLARLRRAAPERVTVFARPGGARVSDRWIQRRLAKAQAAAGLPRAGPHTLRHTFCSLLASEGATAPQIKQLAGHSSIAITDSYMHLAPGADAAAIALLERGARRARGLED